MVVKRKKNFFVAGAVAAVAATVVTTATGCSFQTNETAKTPDHVTTAEVKNKIIYQKNGGLYYADLKSEKEPVLIYDSGNADSRYTWKYTDDGKYFYFFNDTDEAKNLYQVDVGKLTFRAQKNKKNIKIVDSDISMDDQDHDADFALADTNTLIYEKNHGVYLYNGKENQLLAENSVFCDWSIVEGDYFLYKQEDKDTYLCYDLKTGKSRESDIPYNIQVIGTWNNKIVFMVSEDDDKYADIYWAENGETPVLLAEHIEHYGDTNFPIDYEEGNMYFFQDMDHEITYYDFVEDPYADDVDMYDSDYSNDEDEDEDEDDEDDEDDDDEDEDEDEDDDDEDEASMEEQNSNTESSILGTQSIDEIREGLKEQKYSLNSEFKDLYYSDKDTGSGWIASGVLRVVGDSKNHVCIYQKVDCDTKLCSIDDLENQWDFSDYIKKQPPEIKTYAYVDGMEQELGDISSEQILSMAGGESSEDTHVKGIQVSEDGKWYVIAVENGNEDGNVQFMMYEKTSDGLKKTDFTAKDTNLDSCSWKGNELYYYEDGNYCRYSNGKSSVIFKNASDVEQQSDGMYLLKTDIDGQETFSLADKNFKIQPIESKLTEDSSIYVNSKCILYQAENEDGEGNKLYLYTGEKENRLIDSDIQAYWCNGQFKENLP